MTSISGDSTTSAPKTKSKRSKQGVQPAPPKKKMRGLYRFRAAVRMVIANMDWLVGDDEDEEEAGAGAESDLARLNRIMLRSRKTSASKGLLCRAEKTILLKEASQRTVEEKRRIFFKIGCLKCFRIYPETVRAQLAATTYFVYYHCGREVVRQGHSASGLYFILEGQVDVFVRAIDPVTNVSESRFVGNMESGDMFGEVSLLHGICRTATIVTSDDCNLLCLRKEDFDTILKASLMKQWDECKAAMNAFPYFDGLSDKSVRECCILSKKRIYAIGDTVLGSGYGEPGFVHFVLSGELQVMQLLKVGVTRGRGPPRFRYHVQGAPLRKDEQLEAFCMQVCLLHAGACFGLGEERYGRTVTASAQSTCLLCPRYWIMQNNRGNIWERVVNFLNNHVPSSKQLFEGFCQQRAWLRYRRSLVDDILRGKPQRTKTTLHDVPYSLRMKEHVQFDRPGIPTSIDSDFMTMDDNDVLVEEQGKLTSVV